jgi:predicted Zn-dependent peptidase
MVKETRSIRRQVLPNGLTVITEQMPHIRSVAIGIWLKSGSRDEDSEWNGISHFIEHMVFKGTETRSAEDIARQVDSIGGNMDAFTAKECICFNIKVLDEHLPLAMDVLSDLVLHPVFDASDIAKERGVILEEIKMDQDNPDYLVHEIFTQSFWKDHALGLPILGTRETVRKFERPVVSRFYGHHFAPGNLIVSAAGNLDHNHFVDLVTKYFEHVQPAKNGLHSPAPKTFSRINLRNKKSLEQVQICIGVPSHPMAHERRYASYILNTLLGGGMSSRLFQDIRERQGLAYSIYSDLNPYRDTGSMQMMFDVFAQIFGTLWAHKLRSFLTMFGIAWGVGSLLLLVGLGEGFRTGNQRWSFGVRRKHHDDLPWPRSGRSGQHELRPPVPAHLPGLSRHPQNPRTSRPSLPFLPPTTCMPSASSPAPAANSPAPNRNTMESDFCR